MIANERAKRIVPRMDRFVILGLSFERVAPGMHLWKAYGTDEAVYHLSYEDGQWNARLRKQKQLLCYCIPPCPVLAFEAIERIRNWERGEMNPGVGTPKK